MCEDTKCGVCKTKWRWSGDRAFWNAHVPAYTQTVCIGAGRFVGILPLGHFACCRRTSAPGPVFVKQTRERARIYCSLDSSDTCKSDQAVTSRISGTSSKFTTLRIIRTRGFTICALDCFPPSLLRKYFHIWQGTILEASGEQRLFNALRSSSCDLEARRAGFDRAGPNYSF